MISCNTFVIHEDDLPKMNYENNRVFLSINKKMIV